MMTVEGARTFITDTRSDLRSAGFELFASYERHVESFTNGVVSAERLESQSITAGAHYLYDVEQSIRLKHNLPFPFGAARPAEMSEFSKYFSREGGLSKLTEYNRAILLAQLREMSERRTELETVGASYRELQLQALSNFEFFAKRNGRKHVISLTNPDIENLTLLFEPLSFSRPKKMSLNLVYNLDWAELVVVPYHIFQSLVPYLFFERALLEESTHESEALVVFKTRLCGLIIQKVAHRLSNLIEQSA